MKTHSKRGNLNAHAQGNPVLPLKGSVSTWTPENVLNREPATVGRVVILASLLIRWVKSVSTKLTCTTAHGTYLSSVALQRYSQYPGKPGISTLNYGEGPKKLGLSLGITDIEEAKALIEKYFEPYPNIKQYIKDTHYRVRDNACVETIVGRQRRFPEMEVLGQLTWNQRQDLPGKARAVFAQIERQSVNSIIQGSAADIAKQAMIVCENDQRLRALGADLLLQIHDELIFEVPEETVEEARAIIKELMEHPLSFDLRVPLAVDSGFGYSWAAAKA